jgi:hypothetical protein
MGVPSKHLTFCKIALLLGVMTSSLVDKYQRFGGTCCFCFQGTCYPEDGESHDLNINCRDNPKS